MKLIPIYNSDKVAKVDDEDYEELIKYRWTLKTAKHTYYVLRCEYVDKYKHNTIYMHRQLLNAEAGQLVDHKDRDGLNNQKENLRFATQRQNWHNSKKAKNTLKGVFFNKTKNKYYTKIKLNGKCIFKGFFDTGEEAARHYDALAVKHQGEFAYLNFPGEQLVNIEGTRNRRGENCNTSKLTDNQVLLIRKLYAEGKTRNELARQFSVSYVTIHNIVLNISWKHLK